MVVNNSAGLVVKDIGFDFPVRRLNAVEQGSVGGRIMSKGRSSFVRALDGVSFALEPGQRLGLLGHNGSGKSTLLRVLAGIFAPTRGDFTYAGRLGSALNINLGFRPESTGRRNVELKAIIEGVRRPDRDRIVEEVREFSDLGAFFDLPMRQYSAGMKARLAFGVVTTMHYDILLLDEWLGVADRQMRDKAADRMRSFVDSSSIIVLASHNNNLLRYTCTHGMVLSHGEVQFYGAIEEAIDFSDGLEVQRN